MVCQFVYVSINNVYFFAVVPVTASVNGRQLTVVADLENKSYQVSWATDIKKASSGSYEIQVQDENGSVLLTVPFSHSSPYRGPLIQSDFVALSLGLALVWYAFTTRNDIVSKKV